MTPTVIAIDRGGSALRLFAARGGRVIAQWRVGEGQAVREGDILFEMETAKSVMEVESPATGVIRGLAPVDGKELPVGTQVAWIDP